MNEQITGALFKQMVLHGAAAITAQKQAINDLNVFPVPDGDTGTNMSMTIGTAVTELRKAAPATLTRAADLTASALLRPVTPTNTPATRKMRIMVIIFLSPTPWAITASLASKLRARFCRQATNRATINTTTIGML